jgi:hypothetical protein
VTELAWRQAIDDAGRFLAQWGSLAVEFGWTPGDLFDVPRDGAVGLVWWLKSRTVAALGPGARVRGRPRLRPRVTPGMGQPLLTASPAGFPLTDPGASAKDHAAGSWPMSAYVLLSSVLVRNPESRVSLSCIAERRETRLAWRHRPSCPRPAPVSKAAGRAVHSWGCREGVRSSRSRVQLAPHQAAARCREDKATKSPFLKTSDATNRPHLRQL